MALPKADIHIHLEGLVTKERYRRKASKAKVSADSIFINEYRDLYAFIDAIRLSNSILEAEEDFCSVVVDHALRSKEINICHIELFVEPAFHISRGVAPAILYSGVKKGLKIAEDELGISSRVILSLTRELSPEVAKASLDEAEALSTDIVAVGIAGWEGSRPFDEFVDIMEQAHSKSYSVMAHAGEAAGPAEIWSALKCFHLSRIDHGCSSIHDKSLVTYLAEIDMPLAMAPTSNHLTGASLRGEAAAKLLRQGLRVSINSDDPGIQQSSVIDDFSMLIEHQNLTEGELIRLIKNGFSSSMLGKETVAKIYERIDLIHSSFRNT